MSRSAVRSEDAPEYRATAAVTTVAPSAEPIRGPEHVAAAFWRVVKAGEMREHFVAFYLTSRNVVSRCEIVSVGTLNASLVHPREVFAPALEVRAASLILAHNHPSGDATPSEEDHAITRRLRECGTLLGIELLDHVVTGTSPSVWVSLREQKGGRW